MSGGAEEDRTPDLRIANAALSQLSYGPKSIEPSRQNQVDGAENTDAAWYFANPKKAAEKITGRVAFWRGVQVVE